MRLTTLSTRNSNQHFIRLRLALPVLVGILAGGLFLFKPTPANAVSAWNFNAGNIMSDYVMTNKNSMSEAEIYNFMRSKNACNDSNLGKVLYGDRYQSGEYIYTASGSDSWHVRNGRFVCLAEETFNGESSASIIWSAARDYSINPQVLLVLLQKEQGLITDTFPRTGQYRSATGYACPDTAPCDAQYYGFKNQVRNAARMFRAYQDNNPGWYKPYWVGEYNIYWHPNHGCGTSRVNIQNRATASLYGYTPYRPNDAALAAGYGTGNSCSSYGNRNFYLYFTSWFGSTQTNGFTDLDNARWMQIANPTTKYNIYTGEKSGNILSESTQLRFVDKILVNNVWYLRTEYDSRNDIAQGIPQSELREISYEIIEPIVMTMKIAGNKSTPNTNTYVSALPKSQSIKLTGKIVVNNDTYYRTEHDSLLNNNLGIHEKFLSPFEAASLEDPRYFYTNDTVRFVDPFTGENLGVATRNVNYFIQDKTLVSGSWYYRTREDSSASNIMKFVPAANLTDGYIQLWNESRNITLQQSTCKTNLNTQKEVTNCQEAGRDVEISGSVLVKDKISYFVTKYDVDNSNPNGYKINDLFIPMDTPRYGAMTKGLRKTDLLTFGTTGEILVQNREIFFDAKIVIDSETYLRSAYDTNNDSAKVIPFENIR